MAEGDLIGVPTETLLLKICIRRTKVNDAFLIQQGVQISNTRLLAGAASRDAGGARGLLLRAAAARLCAPQAQLSAAAAAAQAGGALAAAVSTHALVQQALTDAQHCNEAAGTSYN